MRKHARKDTNQDEIVQAARDLGATVLLTHQLGGGAPDIIIGWRGLNYLVEIKDGAKPPSRRRLTKDEKEFHQLWRGQICVIKSVDELLELLEIC
jgi:hypothetical protein